MQLNDAIQLIFLTNISYFILFFAYIWDQKKYYYLIEENTSSLTHFHVCAQSLYTRNHENMEWILKPEA